MNALIRRSLHRWHFRAHSSPRDSRNGKLIIWAVFCALVAVSLSPGKVRGAGTVTVMDETHLRAAMAGGGVVNFGADGVITLANTLTLPTNTTFTATGHIVTISGGGSVPVIYVPLGAKLVLNQLTISDGHSSGSPGGGGVQNLGDSTIINCTFSNNVSVGGSPPSGTGGAICQRGTALRITGCTFVNNSAQYGGGAVSGGDSVWITNSTFYANSATAAWFNGPINPVWIVNCTFASNTNGAVLGFGPAPGVAPNLTLANTIVAYSVGGNNVTADGFTDAGHNISSDSGSGFTNVTSLTNTDPLLGTLAANGGPTLTMGLLPGSPAIDAANDALAPSTDQRGVPRPVGAHSDIGAYEGTLGANSVAFTTTSFAIGESQGAARILIQRTGSTAGAVSVGFSATAGTADAGEDFVPTNITVNFADGEAQKVVPVTVFQDADTVNYETVQLTLHDPVGLSLGAPATATLTIVDDDLSQNVTDYTDAGFRAALSQGGVFHFTSNATINLTNEIPVGFNVTLDGGGHSVVISGGRSNRLFHVNPGSTLTATGVVFANGWVAGYPGAAGAAGGAGQGGGIFNDSGTVALYGCTVTNCRTAGGAGGSANNNLLGNGGDALGGGLFSQNGMVVLFSTTFVSNSAAGGPRGTQQGLTPGSNGVGFGGGLFTTNGTVTVWNSSFNNNNCQGSSAGALGGAILQASGSLSISNGSFVKNGVLFSRSSNGGAGLAAGGAIASLSGTVAIDFSQLNSNTATDLGGTPATFMQPGPAQGGAIYSAGTLTVDHTTIQGNNAGGAGGESTPPDVCGGGLFNSGNAIICRSTVSFNNATGAQAAPQTAGRGLGGGIYNAGQLAMTNCTVSLNTAVSGYGNLSTNGDAYGGGIANFGGTLTGMNLTIASNSALPNVFVDHGTGGTTNGSEIATTNGTFAIENSIIAYGGLVPNVWGTINDLGNNICSDDSGGFSYPSMSSVDPLLEPLANYGGPTATMALLPDSPAIEFGTAVGAPSTDQRGEPRASGRFIDVGAFEHQTTIAPPPVLTFAPAAGGLQLGFAAVAGVQYELRASSNLVNWATIQYLGPYSGSTNLAVSISTAGQTSQYYKVYAPGQ